MPELPDLTVVAEELNRRVAGRTVLEASAPTPILVRATPEEVAALSGTKLGAANRRGKFLLLPFVRDGSVVRVLAANPMLAGRFWITGRRERVRARTGLRLLLERDEDLRYVDREMLGKLYLAEPDGLDDIPGWSEMGPDADDPALTLDAFRQRIRRHPGELKPLLRNPRFVSGIGNAYSDEILWAARLAPFRSRSSLAADEVDTLYRSTREVLGWAVAELRELVPPRLEVEQRKFLRVHGKGGEPCPRCGSTLSEVKAGGFVTNWCRTCQR